MTKEDRPKIWDVIGAVFLFAIVLGIVVAVAFSPPLRRDRCAALRHDCYKATGLDPQTHAEICLRAAECEAAREKP